MNIHNVGEKNIFLNNNSSSPTTINTNNYDAEISKTLLPGSKNVKTNISIGDAQNNPALAEHKSNTITVRTPDGQTFNVPLYMDESIGQKTQEKMNKKITKALENLPPNVLLDFQKECRTILVTDKIDVPQNPKAYATAPISQIMLSASQMSGQNDKDFQTTLVHELGHLVDGYKWCGSNSSAADQNKRSFNDIKELMTKDLGFDEESYTISNQKEFFADYYLYKNLDIKKDHRAKAVFDKLAQYKTDYQKLSPEEFEQKYGEKTPQIRELGKKWGKMEDETYSYFFENLDNNEDLIRAPEGQPMTYEQIVERNRNILNKLNQRNK